MCLLIIKYINSFMDDGPESTLSKFTDDMKLEVADSLCCHPEGPHQAGEMGLQKSPEVQQGEVESPVLREEQHQAPVHAGGHPAFLPGRKENGYQVEHESAMYTYHKEG